ncbi:uncharacterized protein LY89DRAFT_678957 [Mollisia scopiformis]|uniref:Uncharacterized protein n=1 Tax=Mollisia scopiformis TaxID=149040 RepID=A0A132B2G5_MOLSC|nr:uncharacterized protein LY89DRAFT_678957 [Mollisia scopiformis]KUJ06229.1 hypothetical protein LY89DRAFT_678957 [Mollisia scopiformis]
MTVSSSWRHRANTHQATSPQQWLARHRQSPLPLRLSPSSARNWITIDIREDGADEIKSHKYFCGVDFDSFAESSLTPGTTLRTRGSEDGDEDAADVDPATNQTTTAPEPEPEPPQVPPRLPFKPPGPSEAPDSTAPSPQPAPPPLPERTHTKLPPPDFDPTTSQTTTVPEPEPEPEPKPELEPKPPQVPPPPPSFIFKPPGPSEAPDSTAPTPRILILLRAEVRLRHAIDRNGSFAGQK